MAIIKGSPDDYDLYGTKGDDQIYGASGGIIYGGPEGSKGEGNDTLYGSVGGDAMFGGVGDDRLYGRAGNDFIYMDEGSDRAYGGAGRDHFSYYNYDAIDGNATIDGHDFIDGGTGGGDRYGAQDTVSIWLPHPGGDVTFVATDHGRYTIVSDDDASDITMRNIERVELQFGDEQRDFIDLRAVDDASIQSFYVTTEGGNDRVLGSKYADEVSLGAGDDTARLNGGHDTFHNGSGHDTAYLGGGRDTVAVSNFWSSYKTEILDFKNGEDRIFFSFSEEGERTFDTNGDGFFGRGDAFVTIKGGDMVIDVGGFDAGSDGGRQTLILDGITKVGLGSVDFDILGGIG